MKIRNFASLIAVAAFAAVLSAAGQDAHLLRVKMEPNTSDKYKIDIVSNNKMDAPGAPPNIDVKGNMDFELVTGAVSDGKAEVEMKTTNMKFDAGEMTGMIPMGELPKEMVVKAKMDDRYRLTEATAAGLSPQAQMMTGMSAANMSAMFFELPEQSVKLGDTWEVPLPKNPMFGDAQHKLTATLVALKDYEGAPVYEISIRGKFNFDVDMAEVIKAMSGGAGGQDLPAMEMRMKGDVSITGSMLMSREDGKTQFLTTKTEAKQIMSVMGMEVNLENATRVNMKRTK